MAKAEARARACACALRVLAQREVIYLMRWQAKGPALQGGKGHSAEGLAALPSDSAAAPLRGRGRVRCSPAAHGCSQTSPATELS